MSIRQYARRALSTAATGQRALRTTSVYRPPLQATSASRRPLSTTAAAGLDLSPEFPGAVRTLLETHADSLLTPHGTPNCMAPGQDVFCNRELRFNKLGQKPAKQTNYFKFFSSVSFGKIYGSHAKIHSYFGA